MILKPQAAHLVYCEHRMLLDRRHYQSWRDIRDAYPDFKTSLGPWTSDQIVSFFRDDFGGDDLQWPFTTIVISTFFASDNDVVESDPF